MFAICIQCLLVLFVCVFCIYVLLEQLSLYKGKSSASAPVAPSPVYATPFVSVLLPVYNERHVIGTLLDAVCGMEYPPDKIEILLLDDSSDKTTEIAAERIKIYEAKGVSIRHLRREKRIGYKAGNLTFGMSHAKGDFIAIFDADCLPPRDFLLQVMPYFADSNVGYLQTKIEYINKNTSLLTRFQAAEAEHKDEVTTGYFRRGDMASLTGSSCVWRRTCVNDIGGISAETITEDVDMGYKAQLRQWKYVFLPQVVSWAELPESMAAFRVQRQRWARGLVHNALRHARELWQTTMPLLRKIQGASLMFSSLLLAAFYVLLLLCIPVLWVTPELGMFFHVSCSVFLLAAGVWALGNMTGSSGEKKRDVQSAGTSCSCASAIMEAGNIAGYVLLYFPLSLYYFTATVQVFCGIQGDFHRTPKGIGRKRVRHPRMNTFLLGCEIASLCLCLGLFAGSLALKNYWITLYATLAGGGFSISLFFSWKEWKRPLRFNTAPHHILITGASGAIGSALAKEYAGWGVRLTLHGRNEAALNAVAAACTAKGAGVHIYTGDVCDIDTLQAWVRGICAENTPDLVIANAGCNTDIGPEGKGEPFEDVRKLVGVNVLSTMALVDAVLPFMRARKQGQIAMLSSLAAYYGLPKTPTYCATKAAVKLYGESLRGWLRKEGIKVNVILPGYVDSPMCRAMPGPKPFLWQPDRAAHCIRRGLARNWARIGFPFPLNLGIWGLALLPACLAMPIARLFGYDR